MLEGIVAALLTKYLGDLVQGLEKEHLNIGIFSGSVELRNLALRTDALDRLELPVRVKAGQIGRLSLQIPWKHLGSQPTIVRIENVYALVAPVPPRERNPEEDARKARETKRRRLQLAELIGLKGLDQDEEERAKQKKDDGGFGRKLAERIVHNMQVFVERVHVRYEDDSVSVPGECFAAGVTLELLHAQTADEHWRPAFVAEPGRLMYKLVRLQNLAAYHNPRDRALVFQNAAELAARMDELIVRTGAPLPPHRFLLAPLSGSLRATLDTGEPEAASGRAKVTLQAQLERMELRLDEAQFTQVLAVADQFLLYSRGRRWFALRPARPVREAPREWWRFAQQAVLTWVSERRRQYSWPAIRQRRIDRVAYINLWRKYRARGGKLSEAERKQLEALEDKLEIDDVLLFRGLAEAFLRQERRRQRSEAASRGFFQRLFAASAEKSAGTDDAAQLKEEDWRRLYEAVGFEEGGADRKRAIEAPPDQLRLRAQLELHGASLALVRADGRTQVLLGELEGIALEALLRPASFALDASLRRALLVAVEGSPPLLQPALARSRASSAAAAAAELDASLQQRLLRVRLDVSSPERPGVDLYVGVWARPVELLFSRPAIDEVVRFFAARRAASLDTLMIAATLSLENLRERARTQLKYRLAQRRTLELEGEVAAPVVVLPERPEQPDSPRLVLDLGHLSLRSSPVDRERILRGELSGEEYFYDQLRFRLAGLHACVRHSGAERPAVELVESFDLELLLKLSSAPNSVLPRVSVWGRLPALRLHASPDSLALLPRIVRALTTTTTTTLNTAATPPAAAAALSTLRQAVALAKAARRSTRSRVSVVLEQKLAQVAFQVERLELHLYQNEANQQPLAQLAALGADLGVEASSARVQLRLALGRLELEHHLSSSAGGRQYLLRQGDSPAGSAQADAALRVVFELVPPESPLYAGVRLSLDLKLAPLRLQLAPAPVVSLARLLLVLRPPPDVNQPAAPRPAAQLEPAYLEDEAASLDALADLRLVARLDVLEAVLFEDPQESASSSSSSSPPPPRQLATVVLGPMSLANEMYSRGAMRFELSLASLALQEADAPTPLIARRSAPASSSASVPPLVRETSSSRLLRTLSATALPTGASGAPPQLEFALARFPSHDNEEGAHMAVRLAVAPLRVLVLPGVFAALIAWALTLRDQIMPLFQTPPASAPAPSKGGEPRLLKIEASLEGAEAVLPELSGTAELQVVVGETFLGNRFDEAHAEHIRASVRALCVRLQRLGAEEAGAGAVPGLLENASLQVEATRPAPGERLQASLHLAELPIAVTEAQLDLLLAILTSVLPTLRSALPAPPPSQAPRPAPSQKAEQGLEFRVRIGRLVLEISRGSGFEAGSGRALSLARVDLDALEADLRVGGGRTELELSLQHLLVSDARTGTASRYTRLVAAAAPQPHLRLLHASLALDERALELRLHLEAIRVVLLPGFLADLRALFVDFLPRLRRFSEALQQQQQQPPPPALLSSPQQATASKALGRHHGSRTALVTQLQTPAPAAATQRETRMQVQVNALELLLPSNQEARRAPGVCLKTNVSLLGQLGAARASISATLARLELLRAQLSPNAPAADGVSLLAPLDLQLQLHQGQAEPNALADQAGDGLVQQLVLRSLVSIVLSVTDLRILLALQRAWMPVLRPAAAPETPSSPLPPPLPSARAEGNGRVERALVRTQGVEVVLIHDAWRAGSEAAEGAETETEADGSHWTRPVLRLELAQLDCEASDWSRQLRAEARMRLQMQSFNPRRDAWEPAIEPIALSCSFARRIVPPASAAVASSPSPSPSPPPSPSPAPVFPGGGVPTALPKQATSFPGGGVPTTLPGAEDTGLRVAPGGEEAELRVASEQALQLTVTAGLIESAFQYLEVLRPAALQQQQQQQQQQGEVTAAGKGRDAASPGTSPRSGAAGALEVEGGELAHPFVLHNDTGMTVRYAVLPVEWRGAEGPLLPPREVEAGAQQALEVLEWEQDARERIRSGQREVPYELALQVDPSLTPLHRLPLTGLAAPRLIPLGGDVALVYEVAAHHGSKRIVLRSSLVLENRTIVPLLVQVQGPDARIVDLPPLEAGQRAAVPLRLAHACLLRVRPQGFPYEWSAEFLDSKQLRTGSLQMTCRSSQPGQPGWIYAVGLARRRFEDETARHDWTVCFAPPLVLENLLAERLTFRLLDAHNEIITSGRIERGRELAVYQVGPGVHATLQVRLGADSNWSEGGLVSGPPFARLAQRLVLRDEHSRALELQLDAQSETSAGTRRIVVFAAVWLLNRTGVRLVYKRDADAKPHYGQDRWLSEQEQERWRHVGLSGEPRSWYALADEELAHPYMYSHDRLVLRAGVSAWSQPVPLQARRYDGALEVPVPQRDFAFQLAVHVKPGPGRYWRTKLVAIAPRYYLVNRLSYPVQYRQPAPAPQTPPQPSAHRKSSAQPAPSSPRASAPAAEYTLQPGEVQPFHWPSARAPRLLSLRRAAPDGIWTRPFSLDQWLSFDLKLRRATAAPSLSQSEEQRRQEEHQQLVRCELRLDRGSTFLVLLPPPEIPSYRILNQTPDCVLQLQQVGGEHAELVPPQSSVVWTWEDEQAQKKRVVLRVLARDGDAVLAERTLGLDKPRVFPVLETQLPSGSVLGARKLLALEVRAVGPGRQLEVRPLSHAAFGAQQREEAARKLAARLLRCVLSLPALGISLVDARPQELLYVHMENVAAEYARSNLEQSVELRLQRLQVDNALYNTPYPILVWSLAPPDKPALHLALVHSLAYDSIAYLRYVALGLQELDLRLDEVLLLQLLRMLQFLGIFFSRKAAQDEERRLLRTLRMQAAPQPGVRPSDSREQQQQQDTEPGSERQLFLELLQLNPVKVSVSFQTVPALAQSEDSAEPEAGEAGAVEAGRVVVGEAGGQDQVRQLENLLARANLLANVEGVPLQLNALILKNAFGRQGELTSRVVRHYTQQAVQQVYRVLGSADFLGSPVSLVKNLGTGVYDFFYEPAQGFVSSPAEFGAGIAKGSSSLLKKSVFGIFNTATKLTGSLQKVAELATFDEEYKRERALERATQKPAHVGEGLLHGVRGFGKGLFQGVTGLVEKPVEGLKREGGLGLLKGVGRGVTGLVVKPVVGTVDLLAKTTEGIRNTATYFDERDRRRVRLPRPVLHLQPLGPYETDLALAQWCLRVVDDARYQSCPLVFAVRLQTGPAPRYFLLSRSFFMVVQLPAAALATPTQLRQDDIRIVACELLSALRAAVPQPGALRLELAPREGRDRTLLLACERDAVRDEIVQAVQGQLGQFRAAFLARAQQCPPFPLAWDQPLSPAAYQSFRERRLRELAEQKRLLQEARERELFALEEAVRQQWMARDKERRAQEEAARRTAQEAAERWRLLNEERRRRREELLRQRALDQTRAREELMRAIEECKRKAQTLPSDIGMRLRLALAGEEEEKEEEEEEEKNNEEGEGKAHESGEKEGSGPKEDAGKKDTQSTTTTEPSMASTLVPAAHPTPAAAEPTPSPSLSPAPAPSPSPSFAPPSPTPASVPSASATDRLAHIPTTSSTLPTDTGASQASSSTSAPAPPAAEPSVEPTAKPAASSTTEAVQPQSASDERTPLLHPPPAASSERKDSSICPCNCVVQ